MFNAVRGLCHSMCIYKYTSRLNISLLFHNKVSLANRWGKVIDLESVQQTEKNPQPSVNVKTNVHLTTKRCDDLFILCCIVQASIQSCT